jgi:tetratricopeptide (TPR) repeat protein
MLLAILLVTTIFCKSTGALLLLVVGIAIFWGIKKLSWIWPVWLLVALPPTYEFVRTTKLWSGREAVDLAARWISYERAWSLDFRMQMENILVDKALQRPLLGWGGFNRSHVLDANGEDISVTDGYWIIVLGHHGIIGLALMTSTILLPSYLLISRIPPRSWTDPRYASAAVLAVLLGLYMIDNLSNAMLNPIYTLAIGGLAALDPGRIDSRSEEDEEAEPTEDRRTGLGPDPEAEDDDLGDGAAGLEESEFLDDRHQQVDQQRVRAGQLAIAGRFDAAEGLFRRTLQTQEVLVEQNPTAGFLCRSLALTWIDYGQLLSERGRPQETRWVWRRALDLLANLVEEFPRRSDYQAEWLDHLNNLAWLLATETDPAVSDPSLAVSLASTAIERAPESPVYWNTLGVAHHRSGNWADAIAALTRSVELSSGGTSFDHFYLALAHARSGDALMARTWYHRGVAWMRDHRSRQAALLRLRKEAESHLAPSQSPAAVGRLPASLAPPRPETGPAGDAGRGL